MIEKTVFNENCNDCAWNTTRSRKATVICRILKYWMIRFSPDNIGYCINNWTKKKATVSMIGCRYYLKMPVIKCPHNLPCCHRKQEICADSLTDFIECVEGMTRLNFDKCFGEGSLQKEQELLQNSNVSEPYDTENRLVKCILNSKNKPPCVLSEAVL